MRIVKRILLFIVFIVAVALIAALFVSKEFQVERSVLIEKPADSVFAYVKYLKNQNDFSKWAQMDPAMRKEFRGTDAQPGFVSAWDSDNSNVGKGEQTIRSIDEPARRIDFTIHFIKPMESNANATMVAEPKGAGTEVRWKFETHMPWPMNLMGLFMKGAVGNDLQTGLNNLKTRLEARP